MYPFCLRSFPRENFQYFIHEIISTFLACGFVKMEKLIKGNILFAGLNCRYHGLNGFKRPAENILPYSYMSCAVERPNVAFTSERQKCPIINSMTSVKEMEYSSGV